MPYDLPYRKNALLAALPEDSFALLSRHLEPVDMGLGDILHESGRTHAHAYFPLDCIVSLLYDLKNGDTGEIAVVGNEGVVGVSVFMSGFGPLSSAVVQSAGTGLRIKGECLSEAFDLNGALQQRLLRYVQALIAQIGQTAVCNRHHTIEQQLCRWLLMSLDRLPDNELTMTQGLIANMLGVRREGVTEHAGKLQQAGIISYRRGRIRVIDRPKLEQMVCECYAVVRDEFERLLPAKDETSAPLRGGGGRSDAGSQTLNARDAQGS